MAMWWAAVCLSLQSWSGTRDGFRLCYMDYVGLHTTRAYSHTVRSDSNQACWFLGVWMIRRCVCMPLRSQIPAYSVDEPYDEWNNCYLCVFILEIAAFDAGVVMMIWALSFSPSPKKSDIDCYPVIICLTVIFVCFCACVQINPGRSLLLRTVKRFPGLMTFGLLV